jgi:hypothetical protein
MQHLFDSATNIHFPELLSQDLREKFDQFFKTMINTKIFDVQYYLAKFSVKRIKILFESIFDTVACE